jgi:hypothetical protein
LLPWEVLAGSRGRGAASALELFLDGDEIAVLDAILARLLPSDTLPGGREAGQ